MSWETLEQAKQEALGCTKCRLSEDRTQVVWMDGNPEADLMFIGEGPGYHEDQQGLPFVGAAGKLLDELLAEVGLDRDQCSICNVIKCRPPNNRDPQPDEIETCRPYLEAQLKFISPKVIVTLGNFATKFILETRRGITGLRGQRFEAFGAVVIPTFHPAAALHGGGAKGKTAQVIREDFELVASVLAELPEPKPEPAEQPSLF